VSAPKEVLAGWRAEIAGELEEARKALPALEAEHQSALAAAADVAAEYAGVQKMVGDMRLAGPLALRTALHLTEVETARRKQSATGAALHNAREEIGKLERSLKQIDALLPPAAEEKAA
jgi:hypothetical protein